jgi:hypothetical protein
MSIIEDKYRWLFEEKCRWLFEEKYRWLFEEISVCTVIGGIRLLQLSVLQHEIRRLIISDSLQCSTPRKANFSSPVVGSIKWIL